ncbi:MULTISPECIES: phage major capsid protein [unclassified Rhodanobacter]|uniref:phage major capsid protein n=1 Tax=unclassified Rhodanobacter TaxID=2621553 RepID=UPI001BDF9385|nr:MULTISPECIES: phage major capsid protein [unclassified Rhodanobacter]MBT2145048.1 phage major capsid protein [Rhodanobacter sp. LX-99]MBT2149093.1 phage major capsid protein [Rhodanobacter sp. LX-100]
MSMILSAQVADYVLMAKCLAKAGGRLSLAAQYADQSSNGFRVATVLRSAMSAGSVADAGWAGNLVGHALVAAGFVETLPAVSVLDRLLADNVLRRVPLRKRLAISTVVAAGHVVGEGAPAPVSSLAFNGQDLDPFKVQALVALTSELINGTTAAGNILLATELRNGVAAGTNAAFLARVATGASSVTGSASPLADLGAALETVNISATGKPYLVVDVHTANRLATKATTTGEQAFPSMTPNGGELAGVPVLVSDQVPAADSNGRKAVLLDATAIAGDAEDPMLDASDQATLQLATDPANGAQNLVSLFQTDSAALLVTRWLGFDVTRASGVVVIEDVQW